MPSISSTPSLAVLSLRLQRHRQTASSDRGQTIFSDVTSTWPSVDQSSWPALLQLDQPMPFVAVLKSNHLQSIKYYWMVLPGQPLYTYSVFRSPCMPIYVYGSLLTFWRFTNRIIIIIFYTFECKDPEG